MIVRLSLLHDRPEIKSPALGGAAGGRFSALPYANESSAY